MKKAKKILVSIFILVCTAFAGCGNTAERDENISKQFLEMVYTSNMNQRYDTFVEESAVEASELEGIAAVYYQGFEELVTEDYLETMKANRIPLSYDKSAAEQGVEVTVSEIVLEEEMKGSYKYSVTLKVEQPEQVIEEIRVGQIQTNEDDGKIIYFSCDNK